MEHIIEADTNVYREGTMDGGSPLWNIPGGVGFGLACCYTVFTVSRHRLQSRSADLGLTPVSQHRIASRVVSGIQGILACVAGAIVTSSCQDVCNIQSQSSLSFHWLAEAYAWFICTYLWFDTYLGYKEYSITNAHSQDIPQFWHGRLWRYLRSDLGMSFHHLVLPLIILPMISIVRRGVYFFGCFLFAEVVLPFKSYRDIAVELKQTQTKWYLVNALLFLVAFIISRFLVYLYMWSSYAHQVGTPVLSVPAQIPIQCNLGCLTYLVLNVYFLTRIIKQVKLEIKVWLPKAAKTKSD